MPLPKVLDGEEDERPGEYVLAPFLHHVMLLRAVAYRYRTVSRRGACGAVAAAGNTTRAHALASAGKNLTGTTVAPAACASVVII